MKPKNKKIHCIFIFLPVFVLALKKTTPTPITVSSKACIIEVDSEISGCLYDVNPSQEILLESKEVRTIK